MKEEEKKTKIQEKKAIILIKNYIFFVLEIAKETEKKEINEEKGGAFH